VIDASSQVLSIDVTDWNLSLRSSSLIFVGLATFLEENGTFESKNQKIPILPLFMLVVAVAFFVVECWKKKQRKFE